MAADQAAIKEIVETLKDISEALVELNDRITRLEQKKEDVNGIRNKQARNSKAEYRY